MEPLQVFLRISLATIKFLILLLVCAITYTALRCTYIKTRAIWRGNRSSEGLVRAEIRYPWVEKGWFPKEESEGWD